MIQIYLHLSFTFWSLLMNLLVAYPTIPFNQEINAICIYVLRAE